MKSQMWWYTARAGGIVAWALSAISVVWGLLLSSRVLGRRISGPKLLDLHRFLGGLAVIFTLVHVVGLTLDSYVDFGLVDLLVPMASSYKPGAVAWGVVAMYLIIAVEVTSLLRRRVGETLWRRVHYAGFGVFLLGTIHALRLPGTDVDNPLIWWPAAAASAAIVGLTVARVIANGDPVPARRTAAVTDRPEAALIERTLEGLRQLDDGLDLPVGPDADADAFVPPPPPVTTGLGELHATPPRAATWDAPTWEAPPAPPADRVGEAPVARPLTPEQSISGSLFPSAADLQARPGPIDLTVPTGFAPSAPVAPDQPASPPLASRPTATPGAPVGPRDLPVRTPRRLARTTAAADRIDAWKPARATEVTHVAPPPPPAAVDPVTGEPDPQAYRTWLRDWLAYVESQA